MFMHTSFLSLEDARALIDRAVDKAELLGASGGFAVVGAEGILISASRMDRGGAGGMARARSKAWISATQQLPSHEHLRRMATLPAPIAQGFLACSPEARFPGAGGLPIERDGHVVAGFAASGASIGPFVSYPGADRPRLIVEGKPANVEDLVVAYALDRPYRGLHGDDEARWIEAYGALPDEPGLGLEPPAPASAQPLLAWARAIADRVLGAASQPIALAVVDRAGEPLQQDCTRDTPAAAPTAALAVAACAAVFGVASGDAEPALAALLDVPAVAVPGGLPIVEGGRVVAGLGIAGPAPGICHEIAAAVLA
jgi:uncharacterized protein GlcG (DUF336 family)